METKTCIIPTDEEVKWFIRSLKLYSGDKVLATLLYKKGLLTREEIFETQQLVTKELKLVREEDFNNRF